MTISGCIHDSVGALNAAGIVLSHLDAELIIAHVLEKNRAYVLAHGDAMVSPADLKNIVRMVEKRAQRMPLAYILGRKEFYGTDFVVNKYTLIPRPETELLVQSVVDYCAEHPEKQSLVELGIGSGCVILSIVKKCPQLKYVMALEFVKRAIEVAKKNAEHMGLMERITFKRSNMWQQLTKEHQYDIVVANLPYLSAAELAAARADCPELAYEPQIALLGGTDGLLFFEKLFQRVHRHLRPLGAIFLEIGALQADAVSALAQKYLSDGKIEVVKDDCARDRVLTIQT